MPESHDATIPDSIIEPCSSCAALIDCSHLDPFSQVTCRSCGAEIWVRTKFNHFWIKEQIGTGGMSRVFRAQDTALKRDAALKILNRECSDDARRVEQFEKEARITASIGHPNVVKVYSAGLDQGYFYIAMELVRGGSLEESIRKEKRLSESRVLDIALETARGLKAAHQAGLIHRDVKPGNILFAENGTAKLVDFGLALMLLTDKEDDGDIWATPYYVPPEKLNGGREDHRGDIYSLGASLFHAVLGRPPCTTDTASLNELRAVKNQPVVLTPAEQRMISAETAAVLGCTLAIDPADRYASYDDFIKHLEFARQHVGRTPTAARRAKPKNGRRAAIAAILVVASVGVAVFMAKRPTASNRAEEGGLQIISDPTASGNTTISAQFVKARDALLQGKIKEARDAFTNLSATAPQPTGNWASFNAGLCALLLSDESASQQAFFQLKPQGNDALNRFFSQVRLLITDKQPITPDQVSSFSSTSYTSIGFLAAGLKNWNLGDWRKAGELLVRFQEANPDQAGNWVGNYKALIKQHLADIKQLRDWPVLRFDKQSLAEGEATLEKARLLHASLHLDGPVKMACRKEIEQAVMAMGVLRTRERQDRQKLDAELQAAEQPACDQLLQEATAAAAGGNFTSAVSKLKQHKFKSPRILQTIQDQTTLWQQAEDFVQQFVDDAVNAASTNEPLRVELANQNQKSKILGANRTTLRTQLPTGVGESNIPLSQVSPSQLIRAAELLLDEDRITDSDDYFRRRELIVAYALKSNLTASAYLRGELLAKEHMGFRERWQRLQLAPPGS